MESEKIVQWQKKQTSSNRLALGLDPDGALWIAEKNFGGSYDRSRLAAGKMETAEAVPPPDNATGSPHLLGGSVLFATQSGLWTDGKIVLAGQFNSVATAAAWGQNVVLAAGRENQEGEGVYLLYWSGSEDLAMHRLAERGWEVSVCHNGRWVGMAWTDDEGVHTVAAEYEKLSSDGLLRDLTSYYRGDGEVYAMPSVAVDPSGHPHVLFGILRKESGALVPTGQLQLNFERISFRARTDGAGGKPGLIVHRRRVYMLYTARPETTTVRWRIPGTSIWDGSQNFPGAHPSAISTGDDLYLATDQGLWRMAAGSADEGSDILHHSWATPDAGEGEARQAKRLAGRQFSFDHDEEESPGGLLKRIAGWFRR